jgi:ABC-type bacteriocin/lantibiotic exporter with double-glycine peptidase domain
MQKRSSDHKYFPKLKRVRQKTNVYCGPAVIEMLGSFIGKYVNQNKLVALCKFEEKIVKYGLSIEDLAVAVKIMIPNASFWYKENSKINELDRLVNFYKYPVGVEWQGVFEEYSDGENGHFSVVTHIDKKKKIILLSDPYRRFAKIDREFKLDLFKKRWWELNEVEDPKTKRVKMVKNVRMMFILTPKDATFPKSLGMKTS